MEEKIVDAERYHHVIDLTEDGILNHAEDTGDSFICKKTGAPVSVTTVDRSMHYMKSGGGFGEVRPIDHIFCPECTGKPDIITGEGIYIGDMVKAGSETAKTLFSGGLEKLERVHVVSNTSAASIGAISIAAIILIILALLAYLLI